MLLRRIEVASHERDDQLLEDPLEQPVKYELILPLEVGTVLVVAIVAQPLDLVDLKARQQELFRVCLKPVELDKLLDLLAEHLFVFLGAMQEIAR